MRRAFDKAVRRKPLAGAADVCRYGNSIEEIVSASGPRIVVQDYYSNQVLPAPKTG